MKNHNQKDIGANTSSDVIGNELSDDLKVKLKALLISRTQLKEKNEKLEGELDKAKKLNAALQTELSKCKSQQLNMVEFQDENAVKALQSQIDALKSSNENLSNENNNLNNKVAELAAKLEDAQKYPDNNEEISKQIGKVLLEAQIGAQRLIDNANKEVELAKKEKEAVTEAFIIDIDKIRLRLDDAKKRHMEILGDINSKIENLDDMLISSKESFLNN